MRHTRHLACALGLLAAACAGEQVETTAPATAIEFDAAQVLAISAEFAIQKGMEEACDGSEPDLLSPFLDELRDLGASPELVKNAEGVATDMYDMARSEEPEYVCTPEMFEGATERVAKAQADWAAIKEGAE